MYSPRTAARQDHASVGPPRGVTSTKVQLPGLATVLVAIFIITYAAIALEHPLKISKSGSALVGAGLLWTIYALSMGDAQLVGKQLGESLMGTAQIVFFLMGAMTIVEVVDAHNGFDIVTTRVQTAKLSTLMWLVGFVSLSSAPSWTTSPPRS